MRSLTQYFCHFLLMCLCHCRCFCFVFAVMASRTNWCVSECSHRRPSSLSQRGFHWQLCLCVYIQIQIYLCLSVWALYLHVCLGLGLCLCLCSWLYIRLFFFIHIYIYIFIYSAWRALEPTGVWVSERSHRRPSGLDGGR